MDLLNITISDARTALWNTEPYRFQSRVRLRVRGGLGMARPHTCARCHQANHISTAFHYAAAELRFAVWIFEINDGDGNPRVACSVAGLYRTLVRANDQMIVLATDPDWSTVRRAIAHDGREVGKVAAVN